MSQLGPDPLESCNMLQERCVTTLKIPAEEASTMHVC